MRPETRRRSATRRSSSAASARRRRSLSSPTARNTSPATAKSSSARRYGVPPSAPSASRARASESAAVLAAASGAAVATVTACPDLESVTMSSAGVPSAPARRIVSSSGRRATRPLTRSRPSCAHVGGGQPEEPVLDGDALTHVQRDGRVAPLLEAPRLRLAPGRVQVDDVALGDRLVELDLDRARRLVESAHPTDEHATVAAAPAAAHVVVAALEVGGRERAREALLEPLLPLGPHGEALRVGDRRVERLAVHGGGDADVGGVLHAALDLEARDAGGEQAGKDLDRRQVAGRHDARGLERRRSPRAEARSATGTTGCSGRGCRCGRRPCC